MQYEKILYEESEKRNAIQLIYSEEKKCNMKNEEKIQRKRLALAQAAAAAAAAAHQLAKAASNQTQYNVVFSVSQWNICENRRRS